MIKLCEQNITIDGEFGKIVFRYWLINEIDTICITQNRTENFAISILADLINLAQ